MVYRGRKFRLFLEGMLGAASAALLVGSLLSASESEEHVSHDAGDRSVVPQASSALPPQPQRVTQDSALGSAVVEKMRPRPASSVLPEPAVHRTEVCTGPLRLTGTVVVDGQPQHSLAAMTQGKGTALLRVGQSLAGHQLVSLHARRAYVRMPSGEFCMLHLLPSVDSTPARHAHAAGRSNTRRSAQSKSPFTAQELGASIRSIGGDRYVVSRAFATGALGRLSGARGMGRFRPSMRDGRPEGLRVSRVQQGSPLSRLGLRNGDVLRTLNGISLSSPDGLMTAYPLLRKQPKISLAISRKGQTRTLEYILE